MAVGKSSILRAKNAGGKVSKTVLTPEEEVMKQVQFMAEPEEKEREAAKKKGSVSLNEEMPSYLL